MIRTARPLGLRVVAAIMISAAITTAVRYSFFTPLRESRIAAHGQVVAHSGPAPARHRVLVPMLLDGAIKIASLRWPYEKAFERVYGAFHLAALSLLLIALVLQLEMWFPTEQAAAGALMIASLMQLALRQQEFDLSSIPPDAVFAPHSLLEPTFVALTFVLALQQSRAWLALLVTVAALNSEVSIILPPLYLAVAGIRRSSVVMAVGYAAIWLTVTLGLRLLLGGFDGMAVRDVWQENVQHLPIAAVNVSLFLGPLWIAAVIGLRRSPAPTRRAAWLVPSYLVAVAMWGNWSDVRLLLVLYPLLAPLVLAAVFKPAGLARSHGSGALQPRGDESGERENPRAGQLVRPAPP
jgi:hypothetical protein